MTLGYASQRGGLPLCHVASESMMTLEFVSQRGGLLCCHVASQSMPTLAPPLPPSPMRWAPLLPHGTMLVLTLGHTTCWHFVCSSASTQNCQCSTSPGVFSRYRIYIFPREEGSLSCLRLAQGVISLSTTRLCRGYVNWSYWTHTLVL
jgi:hypothetical protein